MTSTESDPCLICVFWKFRILVHNDPKWSKEINLDFECMRNSCDVCRTLAELWELDAPVRLGSLKFRLGQLTHFSFVTKNWSHFPAYFSLKRLFRCQIRAICIVSEQFINSHVDSKIFSIKLAQKSPHNSHTSDSFSTIISSFYKLSQFSAEKSFYIGFELFFVSVRTFLMIGPINYEYNIKNTEHNEYFSGK